MGPPGHAVSSSVCPHIQARRHPSASMARRCAALLAHLEMRRRLSISSQPGTPSPLSLTHIAGAPLVRLNTASFPPVKSSNPTAPHTRARQPPLGPPPPDPPATPPPQVGRRVGPPGNAPDERASLTSRHPKSEFRSRRRRCRRPRRPRKRRNRPYRSPRLPCASLLPLSLVDPSQWPLPTYMTHLIHRSLLVHLKNSSVAHPYTTLYPSPLSPCAGE